MQWECINVCVLCVCVCVCVRVRARVRVRACARVCVFFFFSTNKTHKDLYLTERVQNITLFIFHFHSFNPRNINPCSTNNVLYKSLQVFT